MDTPIVLTGSKITDYEDEFGNQIVGSPSRTGTQSKVIFKGSNNKIVFGENTNWNCGVTFKQDGGLVEVGDRSQARGGIEIGTDASLIIGKSINVSGNWRVVTDDGAAIVIGDDCLFAQEVKLRAYDNHPIYDLDSGDRINFSRGIEIGSAVWVGYGVTISGGSQIGHGSVIGTMSVVTASKPIGEHCLAVGMPATVKRERVAWQKPGDPPKPVLPENAHKDC